jgi:hypothetical protein
MKKQNQIAFFISAAVLLLGIVIYLFNPLQKKKDFIWYPRLFHDGNQPYDFKLFHQLLKENFEVDSFDISDQKNFADSKNNLNKGYLYLGDYPFHDSLKAESLKKFILNGGTVFLVTHNIPDSLFLKLVDEEDCVSYLVRNDKLSSSTSTKISCGFEHPNFMDRQYNFNFKSDEDSTEYMWTYIPPYYLCDPFVKLGSFSNHKFENVTYANFIKADFGRGSVYWHSNPILFTNYFLSSKHGSDGFNYINDVFSHFEVEKWYWDEAVQPEGFGEMPKKSFVKPKTPLEYIFSQPALSFAWILLLILVALYLLFAAKRKQRVIPILETNRNTSLEFINTIGRLYFQQQNHLVIFEKLMQLFRTHLKRRYGIILKDEQFQDEVMIARIVKKTDIDREIISAILKEYFILKSKITAKDVEMSAETLNKFYLLLEKFYKAEQERKKLV